MLAQEIGHEIEVERLVTDARYARDVLLVCDALTGTEAPPLAMQFRQLPPAPGAAAAATRPTGPGPGLASEPGHARQSTDWSRDTSGFGVTQAPGMASPPAHPGRVDDPPRGHAERRRNWLARWRD